MNDKYNVLIENLREKILSSLNEDAVQQIPQPQAQQPITQQPQAQTASISQQQLVEPQPEAQQSEQGIDEVGMSDIQELAGKLSQMIRDFKSTNQEESLEASKFAAGMIISAAIDGLEYDDRKDILKKLKAGDYNSSESDGDMEIEGEIAETILSRRNEEDREIGKKNKKNVKKSSSPFSSPVGVKKVDEVIGSSDITVPYGQENGKTITQAYDEGTNTANELQKDGFNIYNSDKMTAEKQDIVVACNNPTDATKITNNGNVARVSLNTQSNTGVAESICLTKAQVEYIRVNEIKENCTVMTKRELQESFNGDVFEIDFN